MIIYWDKYKKKNNNLLEFCYSWNKVTKRPQINRGFVALNVALSPFVGALLIGLTFGNLSPTDEYYLVASLLASFAGTTQVLIIWMDSFGALCLLPISISKLYYEWNKSYIIMRQPLKDWHLWILCTYWLCQFLTCILIQYHSFLELLVFSHGSNII